MTSNISPSVYGNNPQQWLDSIPWPAAHDVRVRFETLQTEDVFFRRCYFKVAFNGVRNVAGLARARGVNGEFDIGEETAEWLEEWKNAFGPHVSLIYGDYPIDEATLGEIAKAVEEGGVELQKPNADTQGQGSGWEGGIMWLVPTDKPINEWMPLATRAL